jgi:hypothetical protein
VSTRFGFWMNALEADYHVFLRVLQEHRTG